MFARLTVAAFCLFAFAVSAAPAEGAEGGAQGRAAAVSARRRHFGGMATNRTEGASIAILDLRKEKADVGFGPLVAKMQEACRLSFEVIARDPAEPFGAARAALADAKKVGVAIALYSGDPSMPALAAYPEDRIALVNAARLSAGASAEVAAERIRRELWRALCFAAGGVDTAIPHCVLTNLVLSPADVDALPSRMANPQACDQIHSAAAKLGLARLRVAPYRIACQQGWAPAPRNADERAIADEVRAAKPRK